LEKFFSSAPVPGDPGLITLKGKRCLEASNVVLYDELANHELLSFAPVDAELLYVGKRASGRSTIQREIETRFIREARNGKIVVRLKGGDPFLFGRGGEAAQVLSSLRYYFLDSPEFGTVAKIAALVNCLTIGSLTFIGQTVNLGRDLHRLCTVLLNFGSVAEKSAEMNISH